MYHDISVDRKYTDRERYKWLLKRSTGAELEHNKDAAGKIRFSLAVNSTNNAMVYYKSHSLSSGGGGSGVKNCHAKQKRT